jgi:hypothetical protein
MRIVIAWTDICACCLLLDTPLADRDLPVCSIWFKDFPVLYFKEGALRTNKSFPDHAPDAIFSEALFSGALFARSEIRILCYLDESRLHFTLQVEGLSALPPWGIRGISLLVNHAVGAACWDLSSERYRM